MTLRLAGDRAFIGEREFKMGLISPPMKDGTTHLIEATSDLANLRQPQLNVSDLKGVLGSALPSGFELIIYSALGRTPGLNFLSFQNLSKGRCIQFSLDISFQDWSYRTNLIHFAEDLRSLAERRLRNCQSASVSKDAFGVTLSFSILLEATDDCCDLFVSTDADLNVLYKDALGRVDAVFAMKLEASAPSVDVGFRWWVRYVIVPLVSGGAGAALIGWLIIHL